MSSEKGNIKRTRAQKYQNTRAFKNDLYDKTPKTKFLNTLDITDVCTHCKGVLEWRIKYKKYKLLKNPKMCVKCLQKTVTLSYRIMCPSCAGTHKVCPKCGKKEGEDSAQPSKVTKPEEVISNEEDDSDDPEDEG